MKMGLEKMKRLRLHAFPAACVILVAWTNAALAVADAKNPDWPCVQGKVENLSASAIWDGPPVDAIKDWGRDEKVAALVRKVVARRLPLDKAEAAILEFAKATPEAERDAAMTKLFAGIFETVNGQRRSVINGIEKYQRAQKARAEELEKQGINVIELKNSATEDPLAEFASPEEEKAYWAGRIFQERQQNIPVACELPAVIEERLFALSRAIRAQMSK
jgi:hypothetical protein